MSFNTGRFYETNELTTPLCDLSPLKELLWIHSYKGVYVPGCDGYDLPNIATKVEPKLSHNSATGYGRPGPVTSIWGPK